MLKKKKEIKEEILMNIIKKDNIVMMKKLVID